MSVKHEDNKSSECLTTYSRVAVLLLASVIDLM